MYGIRRTILVSLGIMNDNPEFIKSLEDGKAFLQLEDGFWYLDFTELKGCVSEWRLRVIADELDRRNAPMVEKLREYFADK